jgi:regulator of replication initiation timing
MLWFVKIESHEYIQQLEDTISRLTTERDASLKRNQELEKEIEALRKRLHFYENPHTPPSANKIQKADKPSYENIPVLKNVVRQTDIKEQQDLQKNLMK